MSFLSDLRTATNEDKQVNPIYVDAISKGLHKLKAGLDKNSADYNKYTDGVFNCYYVSDETNTREPFIMQLECKLDVDLHDNLELAKVILQVCFYLKQFQKSKMQIPKVLVVGTKNNCFAAPAHLLYEKYVKNEHYETVDSQTGKNISASTAPYHRLYQPRLNAIKNDVDFQTRIRITDVEDKNAINELCLDILKVAKDIGLQENVTADNLARAYDFFEMKVIDAKQREKLTSREIVGAFMQLMLNPGNVTSEQTRNVLGQIVDYGAMNFNGKRIIVDPNAFNSFANVFAVKTYEIKDQKALTEITDRLVEDTDRRRKGDFYTPTIWVDEAHKLMDKHLGSDWREKYMVWDCAWGTGNLTRDYAFDDLYCSTLIQEDLDTAARYNPFACKFQYDFLNDDVDTFERIPYILFKPLKERVRWERVSEALNFGDIFELYDAAITQNITTDEACQAAYKEAVQTLMSTKLYKSAPGLIEGLLGINGKDKKDLVFLINPPYGTSSELGAKNASVKLKSKKGINNTNTGQIMANIKLGDASRQLYTQFLYNIYKLDRLFGCKVKIGVFCPSQLLTSSNLSKYRDYVSLNLINGYIICASNFADVASNWSILFGIIEYNSVRSSVYNVGLASLNNSSIEYRSKILYNMDCMQSCSDWVKHSVLKFKNDDAPQMTSAIKWRDTGYGKIVPGAFGYYVNASNIVKENNQNVCLLSCCAAAARGCSILLSNFDQVVSNFTSRRLITSGFATWENSQDEYMIPDTDHPLYAQWQNDCIVYSLFNSKSQQSSLRSIDYNDKLWDIYNEFFWLGRNKMLQLAEKHNNMELYDDVINHGKSERFVYEKLKTITLSEDAKAVLDKATEILEKTFPYRQEFSVTHPEYHINTWDAGWYQIKAVAKEYCKEDLKEFDILYKQFSDRLRPLVYELGFLYK